MSKKTKVEVRFLYYVKNGVCKSNAEMPATGESFKGWLSAASVIRKQDKHSVENVKASLSGLKKFIASLKDDDNKKEVIQEKDLLKFV